MIKNKHEQLMSSLKIRLLDIHKEIPVGSKVVYFDYPMHYNIGDLLIYLGTESFIKSSKYEVIGRYTLYDADNKTIRKKIDQETYIICHGGGNFGDLYPFCQKLREMIVSTYPNNKIVIFPQSCFFQSKKELELSKAIFNKHKNVVIYTRDKYSYKIAQDFTKTVHMMPDMAHHLWEELPAFYPMDKDNQTNKTNLKNTCSLVRTDNEMSRTQVIEKTPNDFDWFDLIDKKNELTRKVLSIYLRTIGKKIDLNTYISSYWKYTASSVVNKGIKRLDQCDTLITNRLHGHIISMLLSKNNKIIDNLYGKNSSYINAWTISSPLVEIIDES